MLLRNMKIRTEKQWVKDAITIHIFEMLPDGRVSVLKNLEFTTIDPKDAPVFPQEALDISFQAAQELMDGLWSCGVRPTDGAGSAGAMAATERHLKDLQVFSDRLMKMVERRDNEPNR